MLKILVYYPTVITKNTPKYIGIYSPFNVQYNLSRFFKAKLSFANKYK